MDTIPALQYCEENGIDGCFLECGVESAHQEVKLCNYILLHNLSKRHVYLYDTFGGLTQPSSNDYTCEDFTRFKYTNNEVQEKWNKLKVSEDKNDWCYYSLDRVKNNMKSTGYPEDLIHYIQGDVMDTLKDTSDLPKIAVLRLDTDWYKSSKYELEQLYDKVAEGGVIILDDYYLWNGQRKATDEFILERNLNVDIQKVNDQTGSFIKRST